MSRHASSRNSGYRGLSRPPARPGLGRTRRRIAPSPAQPAIPAATATADETARPAALPTLAAGIAAAPPVDWLTRLRQPDMRVFTRRWLAVFATSVTLFVARFLIPSPVGMADNGDGPRLMCGLGVAPVTGAYPRYDGFAFFTYSPSSACANASVYGSSEHLLLVAARWLTPLIGAAGTVNLIALGLVTCVLQSAGIASLACGLRLGLRNTLLVAAALWLIMADAAFFDTYASPYSEGATLTGLLLVAAGLLYLGRGPLALAFGLLLTGAGGYLACLSKEQYLPLAVPVCAVIVIASASRGRPGLRRFLTARTAAAGTVAGLLALATVAYVHADADSPYTTLLHQEQVVDVVFDDIVTAHNAAGAADLRELGLPASWISYAGDGFWAPHSVYHDPLYAQYADRLSDASLAGFLLSHPAELIRIGQQSADDALDLRVTYLGSYAPAAGHPVGALENRVTVLESIVSAVPAGLGLFWLLPLWAVMAAIGVNAIRGGRRAAAWQRDAGYAVLALVGCAATAFWPAAYFAGIETTRHMLGSNLATALAFALSAVLLCALVRRGISDSGGPAEPGVVEVPGQPGATEVADSTSRLPASTGRHGRPG